MENITNKNYLSDIDYAIHHVRSFLTILGIWPFIISNPTRSERYVSKIAIPLCSVSMVILIASSICHIIVRDIDYLNLIMVLGPISFTFSTMFKYLVLIFRGDSIHLCVQHMKTDWMRIENVNDRNIMMKNIKVGHRLTMIATVCMYSTALFYHAINPLSSGKTINEFNKTVRMLSIPGIDIFINLHTGFNYEIIFCSILISVLLQFTVPIAVCNMAAVFVSHACGQIRIVISRLENLVSFDTKMSDKSIIEDRIAFIIRSHVRALRFSAKIDEILREMCLMEVIASTLNICFVEYYCMMEWSNSDAIGLITYAVALGALSFNIFIYCHIGELLKEQCLEVGKAGYMIEWYKLPGKTGLALVMITAMANYPRQLTAGRMMELSIVTFGKIIKTTFVYLNMLRTVTEL